MKLPLNAVKRKFEKQSLIYLNTDAEADKQISGIGLMPC